MLVFRAGVQYNLFANAIIASATFLKEGAMSRITGRINIISRCQGLFRASRLKDSEICAYNYYVLPICMNPGLSQEQLARRTCRDPYNVTRHLAKLEQLGYVERRPGEEDRRQMLVYPAEKLQAMLPQVRKAIEEWDAYLFEGLSPEELEQFEATLLRVAQRAREYVNSKDVIDG